MHSENHKLKPEQKETFEYDIEIIYQTNHVAACHIFVQRQHSYMFTERERIWNTQSPENKLPILF